MKVALNSKMLVYVLFMTVAMFGVEAIYYITDCDLSVMVIVGLVLEAYSIYYLLKKRLVFSPIILADILNICLLLAQLKLVRSYEDMSWTASVAIILSLSIWRFVNIYPNDVFYGLNRGERLIFKVNESCFKKMIYLSFIVSAGFMILEWWNAGGIPVLRSDGEIFRFNVKINGLTHVLAILNKIIAICILGYLSGKKENQIKKEKGMISVLILSICLIIGTNFRGELLIILFTFVVLYYVKRKPSLKQFLFLSIPLLIVVGCIPILRGYNLYGIKHIMNQKAISRYNRLWFMTPLYETLANGMIIFDDLTEIYPQIISYGIISNTILPLIPFMDLGESGSANILAHKGIKFYSVLTSTGLGQFYTDGGVIACMIYMALIGIWAKRIYINFVRQKNLKYTVLYIFVLYNIAMMSYGNTIMELSFICYYLYLSVLFKFTGSGNNVDKT